MILWRFRNLENQGDNLNTTHYALLKTLKNASRKHVRVTNTPLHPTFI